MKMRLSISTAITLFGLILAVGFASVVLTGASSLHYRGAPRLVRRELSGDSSIAPL